VSPLVAPRRFTLDGVGAGNGGAPALVPAGDTLFCFAIGKTGRRPEFRRRKYYGLLRSGYATPSRTRWALSSPWASTSSR